MFEKYENMNFKDMTPDQMIVMLQDFLNKNCISLEECELNLQKCEELIDSTFKEEKISAEEKLFAIKLSWDMYVDYKNIVIPETHKMISEIKKLLSFIKENKDNL